MMMPANAEHIRMSLFILVGSGFDLIFIGLSFIGSSVGLRKRVDLELLIRWPHPKNAARTFQGRNCRYSFA
jgi:hypothetical protein